ncbi:ATP-binding protein [Streptomyces sp. HNM0663]|uniref:ATP-binding protein n=1 Tax=Streptomyces chengmaiensis TaxID=3040919 RepID=A0ABT6HW50_9ACTN|nr:ATP-binding protein [Streptomyces chengmaiensis]MDH2392936.1 ATP-binding protein [Streptomyces chengmaiensis]
MSLPLTRRIARAALLVAAGAAPVVGAAGSASALEAPQLPAGGLTALDAGSAAGTLDGGAQQSTALVSEVGGDALQNAVPAAGSVVGQAGSATVPAAQQAAGNAAATTGDAVGKTAGTASSGAGGGMIGGLPAGVPLG